MGVHNTQNKIGCGATLISLDTTCNLLLCSHRSCPHGLHSLLVQCTCPTTRMSRRRDACAYTGWKVTRRRSHYRFQHVLKLSTRVDRSQPTSRAELHGFNTIRTLYTGRGRVEIMQCQQVSHFYTGRTRVGVCNPDIFVVVWKGLTCSVITSLPLASNITGDLKNCDIYAQWIFCPGQTLPAIIYPSWGCHPLLLHLILCSWNVMLNLFVLRISHPN